MTQASRWLIYALGGGLGHVTRSLALARAARRQGIRCSLLCNSQYLSTIPLLDELGDGDELFELDPQTDLEAARQIVREFLTTSVTERLPLSCKGVRRHGRQPVPMITDDPPAVLLVDTFPRGLGGELASLLPLLPLPKVLIHRALSPDYVARFHLADQLQAFDLILAPGEDGAFADHERTVRTPAWLIRDRDELVPSAEGRSFWLEGRPDRGQPVVLVLGTGRATEVSEMAQFAEHLASRFGSDADINFVAPPNEVLKVTADDSSVLDRAHRRELFPLLPYLLGVDLLIGSGGYNTVAEARATGTPFVALARDRLYDRQADRLHASERARDWSDLEDRVRSFLINRDASFQPQPTSFINGAHAAVEAVLARTM